MKDEPPRYTRASQRRAERRRCEHGQLRMPIPRDELQALILDFVDEDHPDCVSGIDFIAKLSRQLGEFLDEHDATDEEYRIVVTVLLDPFLSARDLSPDIKRDVLRACEDGFGVKIHRTH